MRNESNTKYVVRVEHNYYAGTLYTPKDGLVRDESGDIRVFSTREAAEVYAETRNNAGGSLNHGEYAKPDFTVEQFRGEEQ